MNELGNVVRTRRSGNWIGEYIWAERDERRVGFSDTWLRSDPLEAHVVRLTIMVIVAALTASACNSVTDTNIDDASPALGVALSAVAAGPSAFGDSVRITVRNTADGPRYLQRCGTEPLLLVAELVNGVWTDGVQNFECPLPVTPVAIALASGDSLTVVRFLSISGNYRFVAFASASADLSNAARTKSNAVPFVFRSSSIMNRISFRRSGQTRYSLSAR